DRQRNRDRVGEEVGEGHAGERHDQRRRLRVWRAAQPDEHLSGGLRGQQQDRHVEQRPIERIRRPRIDRRLAPAAGGGDDHRRVRPAQDQRRDVDDVRHRHVGAAGNRKLNLERGGERRQQDQEDERQHRRELRARDQREKREHAERDDEKDVPARARRKIPEQNPTSIPVRRARRDGGWAPRRRGFELTKFKQLFYTNV